MSVVKLLKRKFLVDLRFVKNRQLLNQKLCRIIRADVRYRHFMCFHVFWQEPATAIVRLPQSAWRQPAISKQEELKDEDLDYQRPQSQYAGDKGARDIREAGL